MIGNRDLGLAGSAMAASASGDAFAGITVRPSARFLTSAVPAAAVTVGLFLMMTQLIRVEEVTLVEKENRPLFEITPQRTPTPVERKAARPVPLPNVDLPPTPPVEKTPANVDGPAVYVPGPGTWRLQLEPVRFAPVQAHPMDGRVATPVRAPVPTYPAAMARQGISGTCDVRFSLTPQGRPYGVAAACSPAGFEKEAARAVSKAEFLPKIEQGMPVESHNYVYPLEFRIAE